MSTHAVAEAPISRTILVIEDDVDARDVISQLLSERGHHVRLAANGQEGLDLLHRENIDLIILDLWLPVMDGWQFRAVQRSDSTLSAVPVIAMSADRSPQSAGIHADCYLRKPFDPVQILLAVERVFLEQERQRLADRLRETERLTMLGTITASLAHEISNPLTYVLGNVHVLEELVASTRRPSGVYPNRDLMRNIAEILSDIRMGTERIRAVLATLQPLTRRREETLTSIDLRLVLEGSIAIVWNQIRHRARLTKDFQDLPPVVGDEAQLGQVFVNLLANAAQAIPPGACAANEIKVVARVAAGEVLIEICDTGVGIREEVKGRIFEPFFTTKPRTEGTGIGLTLSRKIVEEHGGRIDLVSVLGKGCTFTVALPVAGLEVGQSDVPKIPESRSAPGRILVIDDEPMVLHGVRRLLEGQHQVTTATSARDALAHLTGGQEYDAILCDVMMPEVTGAQLYTEMEEHHPNMASRVIFMSGGLLLADVGSLRNITADRWIDKPFTAQTLMRAIAEMVAVSRS